MAHYPVDDRLLGLSEEQAQLRETVFKFCQKELAPYAQEIDKNNEFVQRKEFWLKMGRMGLLGTTSALNNAERGQKSIVMIYSGDPF